MAQNILEFLKEALLFVLLFIGLTILIFTFSSGYYKSLNDRSVFNGITRTHLELSQMLTSTQNSQGTNTSTQNSQGTKKYSSELTTINVTVPPLSFSSLPKIRFGAINIEKFSFDGESVLVYLAQPRRFGQFISSLEIAYNNLLRRFPHRIVVFHNGDMKKEHILAHLMPRLKLDSLSNTPSALNSIPNFNNNFQVNSNLSNASHTQSNPQTATATRAPHPADLIELHELLYWSDFPPGFTSPPTSEIVAGGSYPSYQRMCSFWARGVFLQPRLANVSYFMRLDTDSFLLSRLDYDPFEFMARHRLRYGYRVKARESCCIHNFVHWFRVYMQSRGISESQLSRELKWIANETIPPLDMSPIEGSPADSKLAQYFNNFEVSIAFFLQHSIIVLYRIYYSLSY